MRIVNISEEARQRAEAKAAGRELEMAEYRAEYRAAADEIKAGLQAPIDLAYLTKITYESKTDKYLATFRGRGSGEKAAVLKVTNAVAEFMAKNLHASGSWLGAMQDGTLVDCYLIQV